MKTKNVGASAGYQQKNGITLIALIITIIVMLILVGVTVAVALNGGLFTTAKDAAKGTQIEADRETLQSAVVGAIGEDGSLNRENIELPYGWSEKDGIYISPNGNQFTIEENGEIKYIEEENTDKPGYKEEVSGLAEGVTVVPYEELAAEIKQAVDDGKIQTVLRETINGDETTAVVPTGFDISTKDGENSISGGLVIKDGANEFVFIPVTSTYTEDNLGPLTGTDSTSNCVYDSQEQLDYYYGEGHFNYAEDFNYAQDKTNIETSINKYKGFYVGRYETTIDENGNIGSMKNKPVLTAYTIIKEGTNPNISTTSNKYYYRWYGLYKVQKDIYKENETIFSTMITSKEWDAIMSFTGYGSAKRGIYTYTTKPDLSGSAYKGTTDTYDVSKNIYDMAGNVYDWTLKPNLSSFRVFRGGSYGYSSYSASSSYSSYPHDRASDVR